MCRSREVTSQLRWAESYPECKMCSVSKICVFQLRKREPEFLMVVSQMLRVLCFWRMGRLRPQFETHPEHAEEEPPC